MLLSPLFTHVRNYFEKTIPTNQIFLYVPYIKRKILEKLLEDVENTVTIITTWHPNDLLTGSSELKLYPFCKERGITLYINNKIHLKVYSVNLTSAIIGSGNISQRGLMPNGNYEAATFLESISNEDRMYFEKIKKESLLITDNIYDELKEWYENQSPQKINETKLEDIVQISKKDYFLTSALPMTRNVDELIEGYIKINSGSEPSENPETTACVYHDLANYSIESGLSKEEFLKILKTQFFSHPFILKIDEFINPEAYFGRIKEWIHSNCTDVPLPRRWELTENVQTLYDWFEKLGDGKYVVDRPNHSQRITKISIEKFDEKPQNPISEFETGQFYHHDDIWKPLGLGFSGGIRPSDKNKLVVVFMGAPNNPRKNDDGMDRRNIYEDLLINGIYHYIGHGKGDQKLERNNKSLANAKKDGRTIHLFHQHEINGKHEYVGEVELLAEPKPQIHNGDKQFVFLLRPV